jgi:NAD+ diphosphatase
LAFAAVTGYQLFNWYESRKHCGKCGALMSKAEKTRSLFCPSCGQVEYPKIAPAVIVAVTNGNRLLLAEYPNYDKYALLAGFVEIGETLEDTVRREVMEEVGLKVKNIRYYKSQPSSLTDNLMVGFYCELDGSDTINFDADELSNAEWVERENIPTNKDYADGSLTYEMMEHFKNGVAI